MGLRQVGSIVLVACVAVLGSVVFTGEARAASGYYVTFVARQCTSYGDIYANKARNDIVESLQDLGPNTQYGASGALVAPDYEDLAPQTNCTPLPNWTFTLGTGYQTRAVTGKWGSLSKVTGAYGTSVVTKDSTPLLDNHGDAVGSKVIAGAVTIKLTSAQAEQASKSSSLWAQGGTPNDPVLANQFGTPQAPDFGFGTIRCATDNVNGDNVEYIFFPSGTNHDFCYAYYVTPPPTSGTIIIHKQVNGAPAGANPAFPYTGDLSFNPTGFTETNGQSTTFYRAGGQTWSVTEGDVPGYRLDSVNCTATAAGGGPGTSTASTSGTTLSIGLTAGETVDCTFVNSFVPPTGNLTVTKITRRGVDAFQFSVVRDGETTGPLVTATTTRAGVPANAGPESDLADLAPGTYTVTELRTVTPLGGWDLVSANCDGVSSDTNVVHVTITAGTSSVCTFTNRLTPAGAIALSKVTNGGIGTSAFVIEATGAKVVQYHQDATTQRFGVPVDAVPDGPRDSTEHVALGTYRIIEQPPLSNSSHTWVLTSVQCNGLDMPFSEGAFLVTLNRSHPHANCRFTNTLKRGSTVDPEGNEPGEPIPPGTGPGGSVSHPGNVWANLSVTSRPEHRRVQSGQPITDTIVVRNHGRSDAEGVVLNYQAPKGTKALTVHTPKGRCTRTLPLTCALGMLKPGRQVTLTVVMAPRKVSGVFVMHAVVGSTTYDPRLSNNSRNELAYIAAPLPGAPSPPIACSSRVTPIAHPAC